MSGGTRVDCTHARANHQHGTHLAFLKDRCRCEACVVAFRRYSKVSAYRTATGTHTYTAAEPARRHVLSLLKQLTISQIEQRSGVHRTAIRVLIGDFPGRPASKRITKATQERLFAVRPELVGPETSGLVHPCGTRRRLQALVALGWTQRELARRLGQSSATVSSLVHEVDDAPVLASTRAAVTRLFDELTFIVPPPGRARTRARGIAAANGWMSPLAWDEDQLDDPNGTPAHVNPTSINVDEAAVLRAIDGDRTVTLTKADRREVVTRLHARGMSDPEISALTGMAAETARRIRRKLDLPAIDPYASTTTTTEQPQLF